MIIIIRRLYSKTVLHVRARVGARVCAFVCVRALVHVLCMYDYYIILLCMRVQCVRTLVGTCLRTCMCERVCECAGG